jgi:hypothetical protein
VSNEIDSEINRNESKVVQVNYNFRFERIDNFHTLTSRLVSNVWCHQLTRIEIIQRIHLSFLPFNYMLIYKAVKKTNGQGNNHQWCNLLSSELVFYLKFLKSLVDVNEWGVCHTYVIQLNNENACLWMKTNG